MKSKKLARCAAGVALFYGTLTSLCQSIPAQQQGSRPSTQELQSPSEVVASSTTARTNIRFIATGAKADAATPESCQRVLAVLLPYMQAYPHPATWTWFVACDEAAWARIQSRQGNQVGSGILAITNRPAQSTIIRGSAMLHPYSDDYRAQPEHIVAHELSHIYLDSSDESRVDDLATRWVKERNRQHLAVLRP